MNLYPDPNSVVDLLKFNGYRSDYNYRKELYEGAYGGNYIGSPAQNERMNRDLQDVFNDEDDDDDYDD